jgi:predicted nucleic acid-binding protein
MRVLLDTDVVLDVMLAREPFAPASAAIFDLHEKGRIVAYLSALTSPTIFYVSRKVKANDELRKGMSRLLNSVRICPVTSSILIKAITSPISDYEDAVQHAGALALGLDAIVTRNLKDYRNAALPVYTPAQLFELLNPQPPENAFSPDLH